MTMQRNLRAGNVTGSQNGDRANEPRQARAAGAKLHKAGVDASERESERQREIFEARRSEILAAHPGKHIAVCAGEIFAADTALEAAQMAMRAHGGRASFFYSPGLRAIRPPTAGESPMIVRRGADWRQVRKKATPEEANRIREHKATVARGEAEAEQQREIFEARREEILAAHPGKHIAVCAGEVFAADTALEAAQRVMRAHGGRASFFYSPGCMVPSAY